MNQKELNIDANQQFGEKEELRHAHSDVVDGLTVYDNTNGKIIFVMY